MKMHMCKALLFLGAITFSLSVYSDSPKYTVTTLKLPGGTGAGISMDFLAYDPLTNSIWVPAGNSGRVDVIDASSRKIREIPGFQTAEMGTAPRKRIAGPSSVAVARGTVYVGNRGDSSVCAFDAKTLAKGTCGHLDSMPDGLAYVASTSELWVTTPRDKSIRILDATSLKQKERLVFDGNPEGFAVDGKRNRFYTNLEDKDRTLAIDLTSRKTVATWTPKCGEEGPHGLRVDEKAGQLFVACSARAEVLDVAHDGETLSSIDTGDGVDDIDYSPSHHQLFVGAGKAAVLIVASVSAEGKLTILSTTATAAGSRNAAVADDGTVFLGHGGGVVSDDLTVVSPASPK